MRRKLSLFLALLCMLTASAALSEEVHYIVQQATGTMIYSAPDLSARVVLQLPHEGYFTIVEEQHDQHGNVWGRLKSGAGWVVIRTASGVPQLPYRISLPAWTPVSSEPSYDVDCRMIIGEEGVFTIVEEQHDGEGSIWGRLKSGAGWVDLTCVRTSENPPVTANYAEAVPLTPENHSVFSAGKSEDAVRIAFRANEPLTAVRLTALELVDAGYAEAALLHELPVLEEDTYLVAEVVFYGDMTAYGISFTRADGTEQHCTVTISGRNGGVIMAPRFP